jgi:tRNA threonylcarbamoyladenosine biosynthesis protein TsaE
MPRWCYAAVYLTGYAAGLMAIATVAWLFSTHTASALPYRFHPKASILLVGAFPYLFCHFLPGISPIWLKYVVRARTPLRLLFAVGLTCGSLVGTVLVGLELISICAVSLVGFVLLFFLGPVSGIWWVVQRKQLRERGDYDDRMRSDWQSAAGPFRRDLPDLAATEAFGRRLGALLFPNAVVALVGPLGAGKTHLTRAVAEGLGIANPAAVTSPTFTLVHEYPARLPIYHFDAYRLNGPNEFLDLGVNEYYEAGGVCLIEWADKVESALPTERLTIRLTPVDEQRRVAEVVGTGERYQALANVLAGGETAVARSAARDTAGETP